MTRPPPRTYSAADTAAVLGIAKSTLIKHADAGTLHPPIRHIRAGGSIRFAKIDVDNAVGDTTPEQR